MSALSAFDSVLPVFDASFFDRVVVVAIVSSSPFRCRSVQGPTEARYQLRDDEFTTRIRPKGLGPPRFPTQPAANGQARVRGDPNQIGALPDPILLGSIIGWGNRIVTDAPAFAPPGGSAIEASPPILL